MQFRHSSHSSDHPFGCALSIPIMSINFIITGIQCSDASVVSTSSKIKGSDKNCFNEASSGTSYTLAQDCLKCGLPFFVVVIIRRPSLLSTGSYRNKRNRYCTSSHTASKCLQLSIKII